MDHNAPILDPKAAVARIQASQSLRGAIIAFDDVLECLATLPPPPTGWLIENAVLRFQRPVTCSFSAAVSIRHCTILALSSEGRIELRDAQFDSRFELQNCHLENGMQLQRCTFNAQVELAFIQADGVLIWDDCSFTKDPPDLRESSFRGVVQFTSLSGTIKCGWTRTRDWIFHRCQFLDNVVIGAPTAPTDMNFNHCNFADGCFADLKMHLAPSAATQLFRFAETLIAGKIKVSLAGSAAKAAKFADVMLYNSVVSGELDLQTVALKGLDLAGSSLTSGQANLDPMQLQSPDDPVVWWQFWRWLPPDRCGILASERDVFVRGNQPTQEEAERIANEYGELRNAFAHVAEAIQQESFCHYKFKDYTRRRDALRLRDSGAWLPPSYAVIAAAVLLSALAACMAFPWNLCVGLLSLWVFAAFLGEVRSRPQAREAFHRFADTAAKWGRIAFDFLIYKWLFGYGVYPLRVLMTAVGTILIFALIYGAATWHADENVGYVHQNGYTVFGQPVGDKAAQGEKAKPVSASVAVRRLVYFSAITFTTTGYGDFTPEGLLQWFAVLEAGLGVVLISILTVVFARQFIR